MAWDDTRVLWITGQKLGRPNFDRPLFYHRIASVNFVAVLIFIRCLFVAVSVLVKCRKVGLLVKMITVSRPTAESLTTIRYKRLACLGRIRFMVAGKQMFGRSRIRKSGQTENRDKTAANMVKDNQGPSRHGETRDYPTYSEDIFPGIRTVLDHSRALFGDCLF